ncbi:MAG TPA: (2Fe-2S)-binding protein [Ilumatobacteraceae bacterium]|nr:(2Fe-2S)-binding protein [Ilumatobacteraceae bacterium]
MAIICHCQAVRDSTIIRAIRHGASTLADIQDACGAATQCGDCEFAVQALLEQERLGDLVTTARPAWGSE